MEIALVVGALGELARPSALIGPFERGSRPGLSGSSKWTFSAMSDDGNGPAYIA